MSWEIEGFECSEYSQNDIFENNFKDKIRIAILNSKLYKTSLPELKDKIGTNIGLLIEEMLDKESDSQ